MGAWDQYVTGRAAERLTRAPAWIQLVYGTFVGLMVGGAILFNFLPRKPNLAELEGALQVALISGRPMPLELLIENVGESTELLAGRVRAIEMPLDIDRNCKVEDLVVESQTTGCGSPYSDEAGGTATLLLSRRGESKREHISFRWRWEERCTTTGGKTTCFDHPVVTKIELKSLDRAQG
jgi:hypothetical protein